MLPLLFMNMIDPSLVQINKEHFMVSPDEPLQSALEMVGVPIGDFRVIWCEKIISFSSYMDPCTFSIY